MSIRKFGDQLILDFYRKVRQKSAQKKRIKEFKHKKNIKPLTAEQKAAVRAFYAPYKQPDLIFHSYFTSRSGEFHADYIPQDVYVGYIDPYFSDIVAAKYYDNKTLYGDLLHDIPQPIRLFKRVNGIWFDDDNRPASPEHMKEVLEAQENVFVKEAETTAGGAGVKYLTGKDLTVKKVMEIASSISTDIVIQKGVVQHAAMSGLNATSVNTLRMYSVLGRDGISTVYSSVVRMGVGDTKLDNYSAGGMTCGIKEDGRLREFAINKVGEKITVHPTSGTVFKDYQIPSFDRAKDLIQKAHPRLAHFRSICWDIAIREDGEPVLIEANLCRGGIDSLQLNNGPLYGKDTVKILDEVFGKKKKKLKKTRIGKKS